MTERTFTEDEIREAISRTTFLEGAEDRVIDELTHPKQSVIPAKQSVIPEGVLCWGWSEVNQEWQPVVSRGDGSGYGPWFIYPVTRLTHPDDWAKAPKWAESRGIDEDGDIVWHDSKVLAKRDVVYAEGRPNE